MRRMWFRQDVVRAAWAAVVVVCVSLAVFLAVAEPTGGVANPQTAQWLSAGLAFGLAIGLFTAAGMRGSPARRAAAYAVAGALAWALMAVFIKTVTDSLAAAGLGGTLTDWPVYALAASAIAGTLLEQAALHVGPLSVSQPLLVIINPMASIGLSIWLFDERFTGQPGADRDRRGVVRGAGRGRRGAVPHRPAGPHPSPPGRLRPGYTSAVINTPRSDLPGRAARR